MTQMTRFISIQPTPIIYPRLPFHRCKKLDKLPIPSISLPTWTRYVAFGRLLNRMLSAFQAPLTMANNSPMELVHQIFVKLGARYIVITDTEGLCMFSRCHSAPELYLTMGFFTR